MLTSSQILAFTLYNQLFSDDENVAKKQRRSLLNKWHPDSNKEQDAEKVFIHINYLYGLNNTQVVENVLEINGKKYHYYFSIVNDIFTLYYLTSFKLLIKFNFKQEELKLNFVKNRNKLDLFLNSKDFKSRYQDILNLKILSSSNGEYLYVDLPPNYLPLSLILQYIKEFKDWKMSAWIISRYYDSALLYQHSDLKYIGCDFNLVFVDTKKHLIIDLSALFFSVKDTMLLLTNNQHKFFTHSAISSKKCDDESINSLIKFSSILLAGDITQTGNFNLIEDIEVNKELIQQLLLINSSRSLLNNYKEWQEQTITKVFSQRSFYKKELTFNDLKQYI